MDIAVCDACLVEQFDDDPTIPNKCTSHLPVQSARCAHRYCYSCVMNMKRIKAVDDNKDPCNIKWIECKTCRLNTCFNTEDPIVDIRLCETLKFIRSMQQQNNDDDGGAPSTQQRAQPSTSSTSNDINNSIHKDPSVAISDNIADNISDNNGSDCKKAATNTDEGQANHDHFSKCKSSAQNEGMDDNSSDESRFSHLSDNDSDDDDDDDDEMKEGEKKCAIKQKLAVGTKVSKVFHVEEIGEDCTFSGEVISYDNKTSLYWIRYDDGDKEEVNEEELSTIIDVGSSGKVQKQSVSKTGKNGKVEHKKRHNLSSKNHMGGIPQSSLITRKQLHCLTGGIHGGYKNPLNVGTPMLDCGGRAIATKDGLIQHICIKEDMNHPLPQSMDEDFLIYRRTKGPGALVKDIQLLVNIQHDHPSMPIFWERDNQTGTGGKKVMYVGHWKYDSHEDYSKKPIHYMGYLRCALVTLKFDHFNENWAQIIHICHEKTVEEVKAMKWNDEAAIVAGPSKYKTLTRSGKRKRALS